MIRNQKKPNDAVLYPRAIVARPFEPCRTRPRRVGTVINAEEIVSGRQCGVSRRTLWRFGIAALAVFLSHTAVHAQLPNDGIEGSWLSESLPYGAISRLGTLKWRAGDGVREIVYSPDATVMATSGDGNIKVWDAKTGTLIRVLWAEPGAPCRLAFAPDGKTLATCGKTLRLWDLETGACRILFAESREIGGAYLAFSEGGKVIAAASTEQICRIDAATGKLISRFAAKSEQPIGLSRDGSIFATTAVSGERQNIPGVLKLPGAQIDVYDVRSARILSNIQVRTDRNPIALTPDGTMLGFRHSNSLDLYDVKTGKHRTQFPAKGHPGNCLTFSDDSSTVATEQNIDGKIVITLSAVATGRVTTSIRGIAESPQAMAFTPDKSKFASTTYYNSISVWDARSGELDRSCRDGELWDAYIEAVGISPDGEIIATTMRDLSVWFWRATSGARLRKVKLAAADFKRNGYPRFVFSPDLSAIAAVDVKHTYIWSLIDGKVVGRLAHGSDSELWSIAFSRDARTIYVGGQDGQLLGWNLATLQPKPALIGHQSAVNGLVFGPDGNRLVSGSSDGTVRLWDITTGTQLHCCRGHTSPVIDVAFSPDGETIASGCRESVRIWDASSGKQLQQLPQSGCALSFLDGGRYVALGRCGVVRLWDTRSGKPLPSLSGHRGTVDFIACSPKSGKFATRSILDKTVLVWDTANIGKTRGRHQLPAECWGYLWNQLACEDESTCAAEMLAAYPSQTVAKLEQKLAAIRNAYDKVARSLEELGSDDYQTRQVAQTKLSKIRSSIVPALRKAFVQSTDTEVKHRVGILLKDSEALLPAETCRGHSLHRLLQLIAGQPRVYEWALRAHRILDSADYRYLTSCPD